MRLSANVLRLLAGGACLALVACGGSDPPAPRTPIPAPAVTLTAEEAAVWAPAAPDRSAIPVLLYHGIGSAADFADAADSDVGIGTDDFAKQMTEIAHAGYQTISLDTFLRFVAGEPVELPPHPLLLTFDDARADSWLNGDGILARLGFQAVMLVDVGRVEDGDPEYLTWPELRAAQESGRWQLQLHAGHGHVRIRYDDDPDHTGPYYAYQRSDEDFAGWQDRAQSDIEWGQARLRDEIRSYAPLAFAPPYGSYGQDGTNNPQIPDALLGWLTGRYRAVFTQDRNALAYPGQAQPLGRIQVTRSTTGGELHEKLLTGQN